MNRSSVRKHYGLERPFDFSVVLPLLLNATVVAATLCVCGLLWLRGSLTLGTERCYFFAYILVMLTVGAALSRHPRLSLGMLLFCLLELTIALATSVLAGYGLGASAFPEDYFTQDRDRRFIYHPVLQLAPRPNWRQELIFDARNRTSARFANWHMNWAQLAGRRFAFSHNSLGIRGPGLTASDLDKDLIFVYGGSTTYDTSVTQGETWVEQLQLELGGKYTVLNFGVIGYTSAHHLIQTAFYEDANGKRPVCAVYYVGWNDILNVHKDGLDPAYADWHALRLLSAVRKPEVWPARYSPTVRLVYRQLQGWIDSVPEPERVAGDPVATHDRRLEGLFADHMRLIATINRSRNIRTIFIGQMLNREYLALRPDEPYMWTSRVRNKDVWPLQARFNSILRDVASATGATYVDVGVENFSANDFGDPGHFVTAGARKFAHLAVKSVDGHCQRTQ